jgi:biotin carboxylase
MPAGIAPAAERVLALPFENPDAAVRKIVECDARRPLDAVLSVDDSATLLAARASEALGLPHNPPEAALAARDKHRMRELLARGGAPVPRFERFALGEDPARIAPTLGYPCVLKPTRLSGSRGVMRTDNPQSFVRAWGRLLRLLLADGLPLDGTSVLVEEFIPGVEVALEGLLTRGELVVLALFDKPDPLDGPYFEETIYVTPSRLPAEEQRRIADATALGARALGLREGPVHAELRVNDRGPWIVEIAGRSIGGLCSTMLEFGAGVGLEELILRHAVGLDVSGLAREERAAGVMMIPIPGEGMLSSIEGREEARAVAGVDDVIITARLRQPLVPLPEGSSYLGFIFARGERPEDVERALREAHGRLRFGVSPHIPLTLA